MKIRFHLLLVIVFLLFLASCSKDSPSDKDEAVSNLTSSYDAYLPASWIKIYNEIEKDLPGFRPSATARALGYIHLAGYHTGHPGMTKYKNVNIVITSANLPEFTDTNNEYHWPSAINATYKLLFEQFMINRSPKHSDLIIKTYNKWHVEYQNEIDPAVLKRSEAWGELVANAVIAYAKTDIEAEAQILEPRPLGYVPPIGLGLWIPTDGVALFPYWGKTRCFSTSNFDAILNDPLPPNVEANSPFMVQALEVNEVVTNLTSKDRWIAEFWSDDIVGLTFSPPARQFAIVEQIIHHEEIDLAKALFILLKLGIVSNDAAVTCWYSKYKYNIIRPENFIRDNINPNFNTILGEAIGVTDISPPFPAFPSGHSTFASACAGILIDEIGENYLFTDRCHEGRTEFASAPRSFISFRSMAEENAYSRIPLGVHFRMDCDEGLRLGYILSNNVNRMFNN